MPGYFRSIVGRRSPLPHLLAGSLALSYAWFISTTHYVTTSLLFVSPLAIILLVHLAWIGTFSTFVAGFSDTLFRRTLATTIGIVVLTVLMEIYGPEQAAAADFGETISGIIAFMMCLAVLALVLAVAAALIYGLARGAIAIVVWLRSRFGRPPRRDDDRLMDFGTVAIAIAFIGIGSLEGLTEALSFAAVDQASSTVLVKAQPDRVWREVGKATSPDFPLPVMLKSIPKPVAVLVDEGATLGARRIVHFKGGEGEGEGDMTLQVTRRTNDEVVFRSVSDTSPIAKWIRQDSITFRVAPSGSGSKLTVMSRYDRRLAPAWFFMPYIRLASYLAVDVLARDTKGRAEIR